MKYVILALSLILLMAMAAHYPLATSWPIGGDAAATIRDAKNISLGSLLHSRYPLFPLLFNITRLLPLDWPARYAWMMAAGQVATGLALGVFLWRVSGWKAAAVGMAIWALTTTTVNNHFEDGTIAQLWSLPWLLLFFERLVANSTVGAIIALGLAFLTHPLTGLVLLASLIIGLPAAWSQEHRPWILIGITVCLVAVILLAALIPLPFFSVLRVDNRIVSWVDLVRSFLGPFVVAAPVGGLLLLSSRATSLFSRTVLFGFLLATSLLAFNHHLGLGIAASRFQTYVIVSISLLSGLAWPRLIKVFPWRALAALFTLALFAASAAAAWQEQTRVYAYYESPSRYARLHYLEREAIDWVGNHLPPESLIVTSQTNRHSEWVPILANVHWLGIEANQELWRLEDEELRQYIQKKSYTHLLIFTKREKTPANFSAHLDWFPIVFQNQGAILYDISGNHR